ncbi:Uncharacterized conserved protein YecE, DUF72 family [Luteibacter sp. UNCMF331Sha3.1]|uniref:DUF72 domain-containing protein n=1 Tax=Luteibacter sp. UNCMF331Sha3.1 TaxID=1502760 RepID=UPI0008D6BC3D|nr:DUF72 domain-containing protein [Luteibacter sp. UNCMF331Sha3.1]SEM58439.1 Uncharacterized conserved protein YecE, DUF72 family [Luteibacter sp. UNCMF331Sha3.1]
MATKRTKTPAQPAGRIRTGMGGWVFPAWRGPFYPEGLVQKRELEYATRQVGAIEINGTYYRAPDAATYEKWAAEAPPGFRFSVKAPRHIVQTKALAAVGTRIEGFLDGAVALGDKLGPLLWQFLPTRRFDPDDVAAFLDLLPERHAGVALRHAVEVRHESFLDPRWVALARERGVATVFTDSDDYPSTADITGPFIYARLMRSVADETAGYPRKALRQWAAHAATWAAGGDPAELPHVDALVPAAGPRDVFIYFIAAAKVRNPSAAVALRKLVDGA